MTASATLHYEDETIAVITMCDKKNRNMLNRAIVETIESIYEEIKQNEKTKVVILQGEGAYFCAGGDQEMLLGLAKSYSGEVPENQRVTFADNKFFLNNLLLDIPTISAMQGHALGGGFALGLYSDILVFSETSLYASNFMKYGFTPGMGATYLLPAKLGHVLGNEMLFTAANYQGKLLKERGIDSRVVPQNQVTSTALSIAKELNQKPLVSLQCLKRHLATHARAIIDDVIEQELEMHAKSFGKPEVQALINKAFEHMNKE